MRSCLVLLACLYLVSQLEATKVRNKCGTTESPVENPNIKISACAKLPCKLKRGTSTSVEYGFTPTKDVKKLSNSVHAKILGIPFPFIGVDGKEICDKLFDVEGNKVGCEMKAGKNYVYKDTFDVLEIYPKIKVWVYWALVDEKDSNVMCFEVPVKITS